MTVCEQDLLYYYPDGMRCGVFESITLSALWGIIIDFQVGETIANLRKTAGDLPDKELKDAIRPFLPCWSTQGQVRHATGKKVKVKGKRVLSRARWIWLDIDKMVDGLRLTHEQAIALKAEVIKCPYCLLVYLSQSGCGLHIVLKLPEAPRNETETKMAYEQATKWFNETFPGYKADTAAQSMGRMAFLGHDEDAFYREMDATEAIPCSFVKEKKPPGTKATEVQVIEHVDEFTPAEPVALTSSSGDVVVIGANVGKIIVKSIVEGMKMIPPSDERGVWWAQQLTGIKSALPYIPEDRHEDFYQKVVEWELTGPKPDVNKLRRQWESITPEYYNPNKFLKAIGGLDAYCEIPNKLPARKKLQIAASYLGFKFAYNSFTNCREIITRKGHVVPIEGFVDDVIRCTIAEQCMLTKRTSNGIEKVGLFTMSKESYEMASNAECEANKYNPLKEFRDSVEYVSEKPECPILAFWELDPNWMSETGKTEQELAVYVEEIFWTFMRGIDARMSGEDYKADSMIILTGGEGIGKSTFPKLLCLKREWFLSDADFTESKEEFVRSLQGYLIGECPELSLSKANAKKQKGLISADWDTYNPKYGKKRKVPRLTSLVCTTNEDQPLPDDVGFGRRFMIVKLGGPLVPLEKLADFMEDWFEKNRIKLYGYAKYQRDVLKMRAQFPDSCREILTLTYAGAQSVEIGGKERLRATIRRIIDNPHVKVREISWQQLHQVHHEMWPHERGIWSNKVSEVMAEFRFVKTRRKESGSQGWRLTG